MCLEAYAFKLAVRRPRFVIRRLPPSVESKNAHGDVLSSSFDVTWKHHPHPDISVFS